MGMEIQLFESYA